MKRAIIVAWAFLLCSAPLFSADATTIREAVTMALEHAPALQAARAERDAVAEDTALGRARLLPYIAASGSLTRDKQNFSYDRPSSFLSPSVRNHERFYGIKAYQPLFDLEKWSAFRQGKISAATGELQLAVQRQQTMLQAAAAWLDVMRTKSAFEAARAGEQAMERLAMQAEASFEAGLAAVNDSLAAGSRHALAKARRIQTSQMLAQAQAELHSLIGRAATSSADLRRGISPLTADPGALEVWEQRAENNALEVLLGDQGVAMADAGKMQAAGAALPKLQLVAGWDQTRSSDGSFGGSTVKGASIGVELTVPLYAGGGTWAEQRKRGKKKMQAEYQLAEAKRSARLAARQALLGLRTTAAELAALDAALTSAEIEKKAAQAGFEAGLRTITEALDAEERLAFARQQYADVIARHAMAYLQLVAATGNLDASSVATVDTILF